MSAKTIKLYPEELYLQRVQRITDHFTPAFLEKLQIDPVTNHVFRMLVEGNNPYEVIEELVRYIQQSEKQVVAQQEVINESDNSKTE